MIQLAPSFPSARANPRSPMYHETLSRPLRSQPLKVLHFRQSQNIWGPEKGILGLCRLLPMQGFSCEIAIMYRRGQGDPAEHPLLAAARGQSTPIAQLDGHPRGLPGSIQWLRSKLAGEQFSILHCHEYKTDLLGALAVWRLANPRPALIATVRHTEPGLQMGLFQALDSLVLHRFDRLTVPSHGALQELKRWPSLRRRSQVVHHAIEDVPPAPHLPGPAWPPRTAGPLISIVGRLQAVKGHRIFLESARKVLAERSDAQFWIVGDGELRDELEAVSAQLGLANAVSFLGYRSDASYAMAVSDVVVCASFYESFPRTLLEALTLERPVVATSVGGIPEIIVDGKTGILAPSGDSDALAAAVLRLLKDPELAQRLAIAGRKLVGQRYTVEAQASSLAAIYREALACM
jgi:glycosyltransferase involved in cell wall biosynthesis